MIRFSEVHAPSIMTRGDVFTAQQYPRQAFDTLADPVLNVDWFTMSGPTFPEHPHSGFSAVTYLFADSPNGFVNRDSLGGVHDIRPGGLHWSRASRGIKHEETPMPKGGPVRGLQIFVNLPADRQEDEAAAFAVVAEDVKLTEGEGWKSRIVVDGTAIGDIADALPAPVRIEEAILEAGASRDVTIPARWGGVLIALVGPLTVNGDLDLRETNAIAFASDDGGTLPISAEQGEARFAIIMGARLEQPIHAQGPLMLASENALAEAKLHVAGLSIPAASV